jgi:ABC-2 type transporter
LDKDGFYPTDNREIGDAFVPEEGKDALGITLTRRSKKGEKLTEVASPPGVFTQTNMLFMREVRNLHRDVTALGARFGLTVFLSVLIGVIFLDVGNEDSGDVVNLNSQFGALVMLTLMVMFGTAQPALLSFPEERPVFLREYSTNHYSVVPYFISRLTMEAIVTGAQVLVMMLIQFFMIGFQGKFIMFFVAIYTLAMTSTGKSIELKDDLVFSVCFLSLTVRVSPCGVSPFCSPCCDAWMQCRRPEAGFGDVANLVCSANVICRVLCDA